MYGQYARAALVLLVVAPLLVAAQDAQNQAANEAELSGADSNAGAAGKSPGAFSLSRGGMIAIIVIAALVGALGIASAVLFYIAKKRQWEIRKSIRRSARRLTGNLGAARGQRASRREKGLGRINEVPNTSRSRDVEKGVGKTALVSDRGVPSPPLSSKPLNPAAAAGFGKKYGR